MINHTIRGLSNLAFTFSITFLRFIPIAICNGVLFLLIAKKYFCEYVLNTYYIYKLYTHTYTKRYAAAAAKSLQSCPTLCDPRDGSPVDSPVPGILQAITLEWVAISLSNA